MSGKNTLRIMTISLPRWPVQRQLLQQPGFRELPVFVCRQNARGVLSVVSWAWVVPPTNRKKSQLVIQPGFSLSEALAVLASVYGQRASRVARVIPEDSAGDIRVLESMGRWCHRFSHLLQLVRRLFVVRITGRQEYKAFLLPGVYKLIFLIQLAFLVVSRHFFVQ